MCVCARTGGVVFGSFFIVFVLIEIFRPARRRGARRGGDERLTRRKRITFFHGRFSHGQLGDLITSSVRFARDETRLQSVARARRTHYPAIRNGKLRVRAVSGYHPPAGAASTNRPTRVVALSSYKHRPATKHNTTKV